MLMKKLQNKESVIGTMIRITRNPAVAKIAKEAGLDFIMFDMEHGAYSFDTLADMYTATRNVGIGGLVRVPELSKGYVSRALDCGANGIMVPMIDSLEEAEALAAWAKYPPQGKRGLSSSGYHSDFVAMSSVSEFMAQTNGETVAIAQIETAGGVEEIDKIAAVDGVDVLLVGPYDLSVSLGCPGALMSDLVVSSIEKIAAAARANNKVFGMHSGDPMLQRWIPSGMRMIMNSIDMNILAAGMKDIVGRCEAMIEASAK